MKLSRVGMYRVVTFRVTHPWRAHTRYNRHYAFKYLTRNFHLWIPSQWVELQVIVRDKFTVVLVSCNPDSMTILLYTSKQGFTNCRHAAVVPHLPSLLAEKPGPFVEAEFFVLSEMRLRFLPCSLDVGHHIRVRAQINCHILSKALPGKALSVTGCSHS